MKKDRRPTSAISSQKAYLKEDLDPFEEDETEKRFLTSKPTCFIVLGKPGSGKTSLCKSLSRIWKCQFVNGSNSIAYSIELQTDLGKQAQEILQRGELLSEELSVKILEERLSSPEVSHYGYVLDEFPATSEDFLSIDDQFEFLKKLPLTPDYIINLRIPDEDLKNRRKGFRIDPLTNDIYTEERYDPPVVEEQEPIDEDEEEDEGESDEIEDEEEEGENESDEEDESEYNESGEDEDLPPDLVERLVPRTEDFEENIDSSIKQYKDLLLRKMEDYMGNHEREKVIELNANMPKKDMIKTLILKLDGLAAKRAVVPLRLQGGEDQEDIPDDTETDDLLRSLAATEIVATGFRWRRSRWGRLCPVALYEGHITQGSPQFAVSFLDKLYVMSTMDALEKFMRNPRPYILNPQPQNPCKLCIVGPPLSGKTTLAKHLASKYGATIIDIDALMKPRQEAQQAEMIENVRKEALEVAISRVSSIAQQEKLAAAQVKALEEDEEKTSDEEKKGESEDGDKKDVEESENNDKEAVIDDGVVAAGEMEQTKEEEATADDDGKEIKSKIASETEIEKEDPEFDEVIDENHPEVKKIVSEALEEALSKDMTILPDEYIELLEEAIHDHYNRMQTAHPTGPIAGKWILDNFPHTREQFNLMVERGIIPDNLICLKDDSENGEALLERWYKIKKEADATNSNAVIESSLDEESSPPQSAELEAQKSFLSNFDKNWTSLQGALRSSSSIEPFLIDCMQDEETVEADAVEHLEEKFQYKGWEYTGMDQDEEEEDLADDDDESEEEEDEEDIFIKEKKKPFGDTRNYCPVALKDDNVLWPGSPEFAAKYREKVYYFSTPDARTKFLGSPKEFLAENEPLKPPALRLAILGCTGAGKTLIGRELAKKFGVFHISFKDRLQELIIAKTKKRIGPDYPEEEPEEDENEAEEQEENPKADIEQTEPEKELEKTDSVATEPKENEMEEEEEKEEIEFTEIESNIRENIVDNEPLANTTLDSILPAWWKEEPFKSTGFILEGFPRTPEEARYLTESGFYVDCVINFAVEENDIIERLLPPLMEKWKKKRDKKLAKKQKESERKLKKRNEEKERRKEAKLKEIAQKKAEKEFARENSGSDEDSDEDQIEEDEEEEDEEEEEEDIDAIIEAEMAEEEEEEEEDEEEETEEEANERIRVELAEKYYAEFDAIGVIQDVFEEFLVPRMDVDASRKARIVQYLIEKNLKRIVENRGSLFDRSQSITSPLAKRMLLQGYKQFSKFGRWCPVQLSEGNVMPPFETSKNPVFPVIYRQHIYFFSSEENREKFILCPFKYLHQPAPKPVIPIHIAVIGPPKCGKTTLSNRFVQEYGVKRLSAGEALRSVTLHQSKTKLAREIEEHLKLGETVPDELVAQAIDISMLDVQCQTRGYVLDGYPVLDRQIQFLTKRNIIPYKVIEMKVDNRTTFSRADSDRRSPNRVLPLHDSHRITTVRLGAYAHSIGPLRDWYEQQHRNMIEVDGEESKWKVWNSALTEVKSIVKKIQVYLHRTVHDKAACISELCVTSSQLNSRLGIFGHYCPVSYVDRGELIDCADDETQKFAAEFRGHYYKMAGEVELGIFLENPERYTPPQVDKKLPSEDLLPKKLTGSDVKEMFPVQVEMMGYCPVTYFDGDLRYEALIPGDNDLAAKYKERLYLFVSEAKREKFMRLPEKYSNLKLPNKLPPKRDPLPVSGLPMLGYMEQTLEFAIRKAATAVGCLKPKFPFMSAKQSALLYMAYHLKAYNPRSKEYVRAKYKKKLESFESKCELIKYLGKNMTSKYKEPEDRKIDFDYKLNSFMSLKQVSVSDSKP